MRARSNLAPLPRCAAPRPMVKTRRRRCGVTSRRRVVFAYQTRRSGPSSREGAGQPDNGERRHVAAQMSGLSGLAQRYATALFGLADERKELDQIANDLVSLRAAIQESPDLQRLLASPLLDRAEQGRALTALLERMGIGATVRNFVAVVARNRRLFALK